MIFSKSKNNFRLGKALALSLVGVVFLLALGYSLYQQYFADTTSRYLPPETLGYIRFSLPKIKNQPQLSRLLSQVIGQTISSEADGFIFDESLIKREAAIVLVGLEEKVVPAAIVRTDRPQKTEKLFQDNGLAYKFLDSQHLVAAANPAILDFFVSRSDKVVYKNISDRFSPFASLSIFISRQINDYTVGGLGWNILAPAFGTEDVFAQGQINQGALEISLLDSIIVSRSGDFSTIEADFAAILPDLPIWADDFSRRLSERSWQWAGGDWQWLNQRYFDLANRVAWGRTISLAAQANNNTTGWPLADFDFCLRVYFDSATEAKQAVGVWEEALKRLVADKFFSPQTVWLSDGTKVIEYQPLFSRLSYGQQDDFQTISATSSEANVTIFYGLFDNNLKITNNLSVNCLELDNQEGYLLWNLSLAPFSPPFEFLNVFNQAQISGGKLILR